MIQKIYSVFTANQPPWFLFSCVFIYIYIYIYIYIHIIVFVFIVL